MPREEHKTGSLRRNSSPASLPSLQLITADGFLRPATAPLCSASLHWSFAFRNSSSPFWTHTNSWHSAHLVLWMSCIESWPVQIMSRAPSGCFEAGTCYLPVLAPSAEVMLSHAWKCCQSWRLPEQPNMLHFQEYERLLQLFFNAEWGSASLQPQETKGSQRFFLGLQPANICSHTKLSIQAKGMTPVSMVMPATIPVWLPKWKKTCSKLHQVPDVLHAIIWFTSHKSALLPWIWGNSKTATGGGNCHNFSHCQWVISYCSLNILCITESKLKLKATFRRH